MDFKLFFYGNCRNYNNNNNNKNSIIISVTNLDTKIKTNEQKKKRIENQIQKLSTREMENMYELG